MWILIAVLSIGGTPDIQIIEKFTEPQDCWEMLSEAGEINKDGYVQLDEHSWATCRPITKGYLI